MPIIEITPEMRIKLDELVTAIKTDPDKSKTLNYDKYCILYPSLSRDSIIQINQVAQNFASAIYEACRGEDALYTKEAEEHIQNPGWLNVCDDVHYAKIGIGNEQIFNAEQIRIIHNAPRISDFQEFDEARKTMESTQVGQLGRSKLEDIIAGYKALNENPEQTAIFEIKRDFAKLEFFARLNQIEREITQVAAGEINVYNSSWMVIYPDKDMSLPGTKERLVKLKQAYRQHFADDSNLNQRLSAIDSFIAETSKTAELAPREKRKNFTANRQARPNKSR